MSGSVSLSNEAIDALLPMHMAFDQNGTVTHLGPGLQRLAGPRRILGVALMAGFEFMRPTAITGVEDLLKFSGLRLRLRFKEGRQVRLKGVAQALADGGGLIDLALDLSELPDLGGSALTDSHFSPTDPTVDMLYLIEANQAAMSESRRLIERLQGAKSQAEAQAFTDSLTGLANRRALNRILALLVGSPEPFALTRVDLDHFKSVNDTLGHAAGDAVLKATSMHLREATRATDVVARIGGDEFVIVFRGLTDRAVLNSIATRIIAGIETPLPFGERECRVSASLGTAISTDYDESTVDRLLADSDDALYAVKRSGRAGHKIANVKSDDVDDFSETSDAA